MARLASDLLSADYRPLARFDGREYGFVHRYGGVWFTERNSMLAIKERMLPDDADELVARLNEACNRVLDAFEGK